VPAILAFTGVSTLLQKHCKKNTRNWGM